MARGAGEARLPRSGADGEEDRRGGQLLWSVKQERAWEVAGSLWRRCEERTDSSAVGEGCCRDPKGGFLGEAGAAQVTESMGLR